MNNNRRQLTSVFQRSSYPTIDDLGQPSIQGGLVMKLFVRVIGEAIFNPAKFMRTIDHSQQHLWATYRITLVWTGTWLLLIIGWLRLLIPVSNAILIASFLIAPLYSIMFAGFAMIFSASGAMRNDRLEGIRIIIDQPLKTFSGLTFWLLRTQITFTPVIAIFIFCLLSGIYRLKALELLLFISCLLAFGMAFGTIITITAIRSPKAAPARRVIGIAILIMILELSPFITGNLDLSSIIVLSLCGGLIGIVRPISWLWQTLISLILAWVPPFKWHPERWWRLHPAVFDSLSLLWLPGLSHFLIQLYQKDRQAGLQAILIIYHHGGQKRAIRTTIATIIKQQTSAAELLLDLSITPAGTLLLKESSEQLYPIHPLVESYTALSSVDEAQAWPNVIEACRPMLEQHVENPEIAALLAILETSQATLTAHEWQPAISQLARLSIQTHGGILSQAYAFLQAYVRELSVADAKPNLEFIAELSKAQAALQGWQAQLFATLSEHLAFLLRLEAD